MAFLSEDLDAAQRLLQWPEPDLMFDEGAFYYTKEDNWFHIYLAMTLLGKRPEECLQLLEKLEQSRRPHARFMLMAWRGISTSDVSVLATALRELASYHRKRRLSPTHTLVAVDADGSLLWHIARSRGVGPVSLPADVQDLILTRDSLLPDGGTPISDDELTRAPGPSADGRPIDDVESGSSDPEHDLRRAEEALRLMLVVLTAADDFPGGVAALIESVDFALVHQQGGGGDGFDVEKITAPFQRVAGWALRLEYEGEQEARAAAILDSFQQACLGLKPIGFKVHPDIREALKLLKSLS